MKNLKILLLLLVTVAFNSCEKGDVITGSPVDAVLPVENIVATISTTETDVVAVQDFYVDVTLPQRFDVDVTVQAEILVPELNTRIRRSVIILAGQTTNSLKVTAPSIGVGQYILPYQKYSVKVFLIAINTASNVVPAGFPGKLYAITSNVLTLTYNDTDILAANANKLGINLDFEGPYSGQATYFNNIDLVFLKNNVSVVAADFGGQSQTTKPYYGTRTAAGRREQININNSLAQDATYTIAAFAKTIAVAPTTPPAPPATSNVRYTFTVRFPNETVKTFTGVLNNVSAGTAANAIPVLQIVKSTGTNGVADYNINKLP